MVGASIQARVWDADEWRSALGAAWTTHVEALGEYEWLIVARRA